MKATDTKLFFTAHVGLLMGFLYSILELDLKTIHNTLIILIHSVKRCECDDVTNK